MRKLLINLLFWIVLIAVFFYFISVSVTESDDFKKIRLETKNSGNGIVVRMKSEGWEVWKVEGRVETSKLLPMRAKNLLENLASKKDKLAD